MNLNLKNMFNLVRKPKKIPFDVIPFDVFSKSLQDKLIELGYKKFGTDNTMQFRLFYYNKKEQIVPGYYEYFYIEAYYENIGFANNIENNPCGCWHGFSSPEEFTKENLDKLFEKATNYATNSKKCQIRAKIDEIGKDFK